MMFTMTRKEIKKAIRQKKQEFFQEHEVPRRVQREGYFGNYRLTANHQDLGEQDEVTDATIAYCDGVPRIKDMKGTLEYAEKQFGSENIAGVQISASFYGHPAYVEGDNPPIGWIALDVEKKSKES